MIKINEACLSLIKSFERFIPHPYHGEADAPNIFTIGYGTTKYPPYYLNGKKVELSDPNITEEQATDFLKQHILKSISIIDPVLRDDLSENQFAAIISFSYNCGEQAFKGSTLLKRINANPIDTSIRDAFMMWVKANGQTVPGLVLRRKAEADLYFTV